MKRKMALSAALLAAGWVGLAHAQDPPAQEAQALPPEIQVLQKKAAEARYEAQALELEAARAHLKAAETRLALAEALVKFTKDLAEKDRKAKDGAKAAQKRLSLARENLENAKQRLKLILYPPADAQDNDPLLPAVEPPQQKTSRPPRMEDAGNQSGQ